MGDWIENVRGVGGTGVIRGVGRGVGYGVENGVGLGVGAGVGSGVGKGVGRSLGSGVAKGVGEAFRCWSCVNMYQPPAAIPASPTRPSTPMIVSQSPQRPPAGCGIAPGCEGSA